MRERSPQAYRRSVGGRMEAFAGITGLGDEDQAGRCLFPFELLDKCTLGFCVPTNGS